MKYLSGYDNIFETEAWYIWGNMNVFLEHLDWRLGTKDLHSEPTDKTFLGLCIVSNVSKLTFLKNGVKTSVTGSCTNTQDQKSENS